MTTGQDSAQLASDAELITRVRAGDRTAFGDLYVRHAGAAATLARQFARSSAEADDLVSEAFARVLDGLLAGRGPDTAFRAYLFTTLRNTAYDRTRKDKKLEFTGEIETHDVAVESDDPVLVDLENGLIARAFSGLPERWQTVLWHTQVEGQSSAEVGVLLGMAPNAVTSLAFRAREGLREAYLQAHLAETAAERCRATVDRLGAWTRGGLSKREKAQVDLHLDECDRCRALAAELAEINNGLRGLLAPLLLGSAAVGYLATLGPVAPLAQVGVITGAHAAATGFGGAGEAHAVVAAPVGAHAAAVGSTPLRLPGKVFVLKGAVAAAGAGLVAAAAVLVISLSGNNSAPSVADPGPGTVATAGAVGATSGGLGSNGGNGTGGNGSGGNGPNGGGSAPGTGTPAAPSSSVVDSTGTSIQPSTGLSNTSTRTTDGSLPPALTPTNPGTGPIGPVDQTATSGRQPPAQATETSSEQTLPGTPTEQSTGTDSTGSNSPTSDTSTTSTSDAVTTTFQTTTPGTTSTTSSVSESSTPPTSRPTTSTPTTTPLPPAVVALAGAPRLSTDLAAGGSGTLQITINNTGGQASAADAALTVSAPTGVNLELTQQPALRRSAFAFLPNAAPASSCSTTGAQTNCVLPVLQAGESATLTFTVAAAADAADGSINFALDGRQLPNGSVPVQLASGYASVTATPADALAPGATNTVLLTATHRPGVTDAGTLTLPTTWSDGVQIVEVLPAADGAGSPCTLLGDTLTCPDAQMLAGVTLAVAVAENSTGTVPAPTMTAPADREVPSEGSLTISDNPLGGYSAVAIAGPGRNLRPGATESLNLTGTLLNDGVLSPGPVTVPLALSDGLRIADWPANCSPTTAGDALACLPEDQSPLNVALTVQVANSASGPQRLAPADLAAGTTEIALESPVVVDPSLTGYDSMDLLFSAGALRAGTNDGTVQLTGTPGVNVTDPGTVSVPSRLSPGLVIVAATGCSPDGSVFRCAPDELTHRVAATFDVVALPGATAVDGSGLAATVPGGRSVPLTGKHAVAARAPGDPITISGPFGAAMTGAPTLRCATGGIDERRGCPGGLSAVTLSRTVTVPAGARVVSAELTWAATAPAAGTAQTLNSLQVRLDAVSSGVTGVRPSQAAELTGANPVSSGQMFPRVRDLLTVPSLAQLLTPGTHTLSVSGLPAKTTTAGTSAMSAWSITVIWLLPTGSAAATVQASNPGINNQSSLAGTVSVLAPAGAAVTGFWQTVWAPDPWATKTITISGVQLPGSITGRHQDPADGKRGPFRVDGFELFAAPSIPAAGATGRIEFRNVSAKTGNDRQDGLWLGPTLVLRRAG